MFAFLRKVIEMIISFNDYKLQKQFQLISAIISDIVQIRFRVRALSTDKFNYCEYIANAPSGVDTNLLSSLLEQQNQRINVLIELMKQESNLKKALRETSRELGTACRCKL